MGYTAVFGTVFVDVKGFAQNKYNPTGRNVGEVMILHGGVSRNVAENLANIGSPVSFISSFEPGGLGEAVKKHLIDQGVDVGYSRFAPECMGMWLAVMDENGDLAGSISRQPDFSMIERIIDEQGDEIVSGCDNIVLEVDMNAEIAAKVFDLAQKHDKDVYVIVGNMGVILKHQEHLPKARLFILNEIEAGALFGCELNPAEPEAVLWKLKQEMAKRGIREMVVTLGEHGSVYYDAVNGESGYVGIVPAEHMVDSTGAGDSFFSATIAARMRGWSLEDAAQLGAKLASMTIQSEEATCPVIHDMFGGGEA